MCVCILILSYNSLYIFIFIEEFLKSNKHKKYDCKYFLKIYLSFVLFNRRRCRFITFLTSDSEILSRKKTRKKSIKIVGSLEEAHPKIVS